MLLAEQQRTVEEVETGVLCQGGFGVEEEI